jgi:hypothetical protein
LLLNYEKAPALTSLETREFVTNNNMVIVPHPPYSPDLAPGDFALLPKLKMILNGRRSETVSDIQMESQRYLKAFRKITSTVLPMCRRNHGIAVYVAKETVLKEMAAKVEKVKPAIFLPIPRTF